MSRLPSVRIVVSLNAEQYRVVDLTGVSGGSAIRERIFSKLDIPDERQAHFSIYQAEIGTYAIGGALTNAVLFQLCREYGDPSGSLKFFVSTFPDRPPAQYASYAAEYSSASTIPDRHFQFLTHTPSSP